MPPEQLSDLVSVGPAALKDFQQLGIHNLEELSRQNSRELYERLCRITKTRHDPCVEDVFQAAIEQAKDPDLDPQKKQWYYWSRKRNS